MLDGRRWLKGECEFMILVFLLVLNLTKVPSFFNVGGNPVIKVECDTKLVGKHPPGPLDSTYCDQEIFFVRFKVC